MAERRRSLEPPTEELKLIGSPQIEETDAPVYDVHLHLSRRLTLGEQDYAGRWQHSPVPSPAGAVYLDPDMKRLTVAHTTIERVAEHLASFTEIVSNIVTEGELYRKRAVEERRQADDEDEARNAERTRRKNLANEIKFD